jgi:8-oxoguanine deaminase
MLTVHNALATVIDASTETAGDLFLENGVVVAPDAGTPANTTGTRTGNTAPHESLDATGCVVTPGLVNAHHHLLQSAFRTLPGTRGVPMATWLPTMAAAYARAGIDPELEHAAARVGLAESLLAGVTTVADHHLNWPGGPGNTDIDLTVGIARAAAAAAADLGAAHEDEAGSAAEPRRTSRSMS